MFAFEITLETFALFSKPNTPPTFNGAAKFSILISPKTPTSETPRSVSKSVMCMPSYLPNTPPTNILLAFNA